MAGVTSVRFVRIDPKRGWPVSLAVIGFLLTLASSESRGFGILLLVIGIAWVVALKPEFAVALSSASGEVHAIKSKQSDYINGIVSALNEAIIYRR
jgi:Family of unknown function (DUF6232)